MSSDGPKLTIEQLYSVALSLDEEERLPYVVAHCVDPAMREELLQRLSDATKTVTLRGKAGRRSPPANSSWTT